MAAGDFNRDGLPDLATVNLVSNNVTVSLNHGGTSTTLSLSDSTAVFGQVVTFTAIVRAWGRRPGASPDRHA